MSRPDLSREELMADIARRVRPSCAGMGEAEFVALVTRMADVELKYRARLATPPLGVGIAPGPAARSPV